MKIDWVIKDFEDCVEKVVYTNKIQRKDFLIEGKYPIISQEKDFINGYWDNSADLFKVGKPIIVFGDHTQVLKYIDFDFVLGADGVKILRPINGILARYFYYFLQNINLASLGYARHYRLLKDIKVTYPKSINEQHRIIAILDKAFEAIDTAKANSEQNLKNTKELFECYLQNVFENKGVDWARKRFDDICVLQRGFDLPTPSRRKGIYPLVSSNGVTDRIDLWKTKAPGVVTGRSGTIGNVHFIEENYWPLNTALFIKDFHGNYEKFIYYFLIHFDLSKYSTGAGVPTLNRNNVHGELVWFQTTISEQKLIVKNLDKLSEETKRLEEIYKKKIEDLEELKKSIIQKAFSGELKTNNTEI